MAATLSKGYTFGATETVTNAKLHALVDSASISDISDADIASDASISSSKINFTLSDYVTLAGNQTITGSKTFSSTQTFSTPLANSNLAPIATASYVSGLSFYALASCASGAGQLPRANQALQDINALLPDQSSANGKFLTSNGSVSSWESVSQAQIASGTLVLGSAYTERNVPTGEYAKVKEFTPLFYGGTVTVAWSVTSGTNNIYTRVYVNGSAVGVEKAHNYDAGSFTDTITVVAGDVIQIYGHADATSPQRIITNTRLLVTRPIVPTEAI